MKLSELGDEAPAKMKLSDVDSYPTPQKKEPENTLGRVPVEAAKNVGATARGFVAGTLGLPGEAEKWAQWYGQKIGVPDKSNQRILPDVEEMGQKLPFKPQGRQQGFESIGENLGTMLGPQAILGTARKGVQAGKAIGEVGERILPGATGRAEAKLSEIGTPTDKSVLGEKLNQTLTERLGKLKDTRSQEAQKNYSAYFKDEASKAPRVIKDYADYISSAMKADTEGRRILSPGETKLIQESASQLKDKPSIQAIEKELRRLKDISNQTKEIVGYDAIKSQRAGDMAANLEKILNKNAPKGEAARKAYTESSEPLDVYKELLGRSATNEERDPALLPSKFFKTKYSVNKLREMAGDEKFVTDAAKEYVATELTGKSAKEASDWFSKNKIWLDEFPKVRDSAKGYVDNLGKTATTQRNAKILGGVGASAGGAEILRKYLGF